MKCPVCGSENKSLLCPQCGFDASRDYEKYPTFGSVGKVLSASALRRQWEKRQPVETNPVPQPPEPSVPSKKKFPWIVVVACTLALVLGIVIGTGGKDGEKSAEPATNPQIQIPSETQGQIRQETIKVSVFWYNENDIYLSNVRASSLSLTFA